MPTRSLILCFALTGLVACAMPGERDFLCGAQTGQPCRSLSEVDGSAGTSATPVAEREEDTRAGTLSQNPLLGAKAGQGAALALTDGGAPYVSGQYRIPEKTGTLWIAPRRDADQILHEATFVHFVIEDARWGRVQ